jgi:biotin carboxyl carrier protein
MVLAALAGQCGPILQHLSVERRLGSIPRPAPASVAVPPAPAIADSPHRLPCWIRWSYRALHGAAAAGLLFVGLARVDRTSAGPAIVRLEGAPVIATEEGTVAAVRVSAGARVAAGDLMIDLHSARESSELYRREVEHEARLAAFRNDPTDESARRALADAAAQRERARASLARRTLRAPQGGIVTDLRAHPGMRLVAGEQLATLVDEASTPSVVAFLPARDRASLAAGKELRLELADGGAFRAVIEDVGRTIEPGEARRMVGPEIGALAIGGPVVLVRARLARPGVELGDGMVGTAEVQVGSRRLLSALASGSGDR